MPPRVWHLGQNPAGAIIQLQLGIVKQTSQSKLYAKSIFFTTKSVGHKNCNYLTLKEVIPSYFLMSKWHLVKWKVLFFRGIIFLE